MKPGMAVIVKPTYACNAACSYCEVHKLGPFFKPMSKEKFMLLEQKLSEYFKKIAGKKADIAFYWLGGEPLLAGDEFFKDVYDISKTSKHNIAHKVQTNLTLFENNEFQNLKKLLKDFSPNKTNKVVVSTSVDPVSDARKLKNKKDYNKSFLKAFFRLKKEGVGFGAVYTVHKGSLNKEKEIYYFFKNMGFSAFNINAMCDYGGKFREEDFDMSASEFGEFLCRMWDIWEEDNNSVEIIPFSSWKRLKQTGDSSKLRCFNDGRCNKTLCAVGPNGDVFTCDRAMQANQTPLGNLYKDDFSSMFEKKYHHKRFKYLKENDCKDCKWWEYCKGSCPYESKEEYEGGFGKSFWCEGYKMLFRHIGA